MEAFRGNHKGRGREVQPWGGWLGTVSAGDSTHTALHKQSPSQTQLLGAPGDTNRGVHRSWDLQIPQTEQIQAQRVAQTPCNTFPKTPGSMRASMPGWSWPLILPFPKPRLIPHCLLPGTSLGAHARNRRAPKFLV